MRVFARKRSARSDCLLFAYAWNMLPFTNTKGMVYNTVIYNSVKNPRGGSPDFAGCAVPDRS